MPTTPILRLPYPTPNDPPDGPAQIQALAEAIEGTVASGAPGVFLIGEVRFVAVAAAPTGWLTCDGAAISRTVYARLFAAISTLFGAGDGSSTFNVPDLRGRVPVGVGQGSGLTARTIGTRWGVEAVALSTAQMPNHAHGGVTGQGNASNYRIADERVQPNSYFNTTPFGGVTSMDSIAWGGMHTHPISAEGGNQAHDNTQLSLAVPAYIYAGA